MRLCPKSSALPPSKHALLTSFLRSPPVDRSRPSSLAKPLCSGCENPVPTAMDVRASVHHLSSLRRLFSGTCRRIPCAGVGGGIRAVKASARPGSLSGMISSEAIHRRREFGKRPGAVTSSFEAIEFASVKSRVEPPAKADNASANRAAKKPPILGGPFLSRIWLSRKGWRRISAMPRFQLRDQGPPVFRWSGGPNFLRCSDWGRGVKGH